MVATDGGLASTLGESRDRVMLIDAGGTCGLSPPTLQATPGPGRAGSAGARALGAAWTALEPVSGPGLAVKQFDAVWVYREFSYCPSANMDPNVVPELYDHQCYAKCLRSNKTCEGEDCYCEGAIDGYDTPDTRALCIPESMCLELCAGIEACVSVDVHLTAPRCFLNEGASCGVVAHEELISKSDHYRLIWKQRDAADDGILATGRGPVYAAREWRDGAYAPRGTRRATSIARDLGYSWPWLLRFGPIAIHAPGEYKVCFCDETAVPTKRSGQQCETERDFRVLLGTLHASGVACLVGQERFRRDECVEMYHGGMRCGVETPEFPTTPAGPELPSLADEQKVQALWVSCTTRRTRDPAMDVLCGALQTFYGAQHLDAAVARTAPGAELPEDPW